MAKTVSITSNELFARGYADRLILRELAEIDNVMKLSELADRLAEDGLGLAAVRSLLASNSERFAYHERRWIPVARIKAKGRPVHEAIRLTLEAYGAPMPFPGLVAEVARTHEVEPAEIEVSVQRIVESDPTFIYLTSDDVALAKWAFLSTDETIDRGLALDQLDRAHVEEIAGKLEDIDWLVEGHVTEAVKRVAPVSVKALAAAAWLKLNSQDLEASMVYDGRELYSQIVTTPGFVIGSDGVIYPESQAKKWITVALKLADKLAPTVDVEDVAPIDVQDEDVDRMVAKILESEQSVPANRLLEEFYEITPSNKTYPDDLSNLMAALTARKDIWWVGGDRFRKPESAPDFIYGVPEPFQFPVLSFPDAEGEEIDVELTDDGLSSSLRRLLSHSLATDVLDEDPMPVPKVQQESLNLVLKSIHRELGTFPLAQIPTGWLSNEPGIQEMIWIDPNGNEIQAWVNLEARLIFGLIDWWFEQPIENGAAFTLAKTPKPNVFDFAWAEQPDPVVFISSQRMEELRDIQARSAEMSTFDILMDVMAHWPKGADFLTLLAEVNVVRRTTRRLVASLLSSYQCFYQRQGSPVWHFDSKKVDLGFDKTKKKFIVKK